MSRENYALKKTEDGANSKIASFIGDISKWRKPKNTDIEGLYKQLDRYIKYCTENDIRVTNMACYLALGLSRSTISEWASGTHGNAEQRKFANYVRQVCGTYREMMGVEGEINPTTLIWLQKNHDGFKDVQEVVVKPHNDEDEIDEEAIRRKYLKGTVKQIEETVPVNVEYTEED